VRLTAKAPKAPKPGKGSAPVIDADEKAAAKDIYMVYFHGSAYRPCRIPHVRRVVSGFVRPSVCFLQKYRTEFLRKLQLAMFR